MAALSVGEALDGVAEHGARHFRGMIVEEFQQQFHTAVFSYLAQQPAGGFVNQVVGMVEQFSGNTQGVVVASFAHRCHGGYNGHALVPQVAVHSGEFVKDGGFGGVAYNPVAQNLGGDEVDQVPVVSAVEDGEVEIDGGAAIVVSFLPPVDFNEHEEPGEAYFVPGRGREGVDVGNLRFVAMVADHGACQGHHDAEKAVALAILAGTGLEESLQDGGAVGIGQVVEFSGGFFGCVHGECRRKGKGHAPPRGGDMAFVDRCRDNSESYSSASLLSAYALSSFS